MLTHFQFQPLYIDEKLPGWSISFYYKQQFYQAVYQTNGTIEYKGAQPSPEDEKQAESMIHDLMIYHVYDK